MTPATLARIMARHQLDRRDVLRVVIFGYGHPGQTFTRNGTTFHAHTYPHWAREPWRQITSLDAGGDLERIVGNYDVEAGGVASTEEDARFIAGAREWVPRLLATVEALRPIILQMAATPFIQEDWRRRCPVCRTVNDVGAHTSDCPVAQAAAMKTRMGW